METGVQASIYGGIQRFDKRDHLARIVAARNASVAKERTSEKESSDDATLQPCPVCGKTADVVRGMGGWRTECLVGGCRHRTEGFAERADAIEAWNAAGSNEEAKPPTEKQAASRTVAAKVCGLANRIPRSVPRKEAFSRAWAIVRNGGLELPVTGVSFGSRQEAIGKLARYDPKDIIALLVPEAGCVHDTEAIAVKVMVNGGKGIYTLGYIPRTETKIARAFLGAVPELRLIDGETKGARIRLAA